MYYLASLINMSPIPVSKFSKGVLLVDINKKK